MLLFGLKVRESEEIMMMELGSVFAKVCGMVDDEYKYELFHAYYRIMDKFNDFELIDGDCESYFVLSISKHSVYLVDSNDYFDIVFERDEMPYGVFFVKLSDADVYNTIKFTRIM